MTTVNIKPQTQTTIRSLGTGLHWQNIRTIGGAAALLVVLTALLEILITFLPGGYESAETVTEWFSLLQSHPFLGLRNLGLLNIIMTSLDIPLAFALFWVHRKISPSLASLALILSVVGAAIFFATNRAFPMLDLSGQYAAAATDAERGVLEAAGQAMLAVGQSHTAGTFLAFFFSELAGIAMAIVLLQGKIFPKMAAFAGLIGYGILMIFDYLSSFVAGSYQSILLLAMVGGLLNIAWYILTGLKLLKLGKAGAAAENN